jgi:hypothetical protein
MLEPELEPAVGEPLEPVLRDGWPGHVAAEPLELSPVTPVDGLLGVDVDASVFGNRLVLLASHAAAVPGSADSMYGRRHARHFVQ